MIKLKKYYSTRVSQKYIKWLKDSEVTKFTEIKNQNISILSVKKFIKKILYSNNNFLFRIIYKNQHVGNIKIGPVDTKKNIAPIGYIIGEKKHWNKGIATYAIKHATLHAKKILKLKMVYSKVNNLNIGSIKALKKNNFLEKKKKKSKNQKNYKFFYKNL